MKASRERGEHKQPPVQSLTLMGLAGTGSIVDAAHWRAMQSLAAVARMCLAPPGRAAALRKTLLWLTQEDSSAEVVSAPGAVLEAGA